MLLIYLYYDMPQIDINMILVTIFVFHLGIEPLHRTSLGQGSAKNDTVPIEALYSIPQQIDMVEVSQIL